MARGKEAAAAANRRARAELEAKLASAEDAIQTLQYKLRMAEAELKGWRSGGAIYADFDHRAKIDLEYKLEKVQQDFERLGAVHNETSYRLAAHFEIEHGLVGDAAVAAATKITGGVIADRQGRIVPVPSFPGGALL